MTRGVYFDSGPVASKERIERAVMALGPKRCRSRYPWGSKGRCIMPVRFRGGHWHPDDGTSNVWHLDEEGNRW